MAVNNTVGMKTWTVVGYDLDLMVGRAVVVEAEDPLSAKQIAQAGNISVDMFMVFEGHLRNQLVGVTEVRMNIPAVDHRAAESEVEERLRKEMEQEEGSDGSE